MVTRTGSSSPQQMDAEKEIVNPEDRTREATDTPRIRSNNQMANTREEQSETTEDVQLHQDTGDTHDVDHSRE